MNRKISLSIEDIYIKYAGEAFGATGSHNALTLRMIFGSAWDGTAKTAYFTDALGSASVSIVLGLDKLVGGAYEVDVPSEALKYAGEATVTIKGVLTSGDTTTKAITTAAGHFRVLDSELPESAGNAGTITASDKEQLQAEIDGLENLFTTTKTAAETAAANAKASEDKAKASEESAGSSATAAEASKTAAAGSAATAAEKATAASDSASKAAASQTAAKSSEDKVKASETAAESAKTAAEAAKAEAAESAESASASAQTAQGAASSAGTAASTASSAAAAASGSASDAAGSAAAAAQSAASVAGINKTAESWAVGGTGTREGENTNNAKYWANQAQAVVGGDFATKTEAQGYVADHNQSATAHSDIREAVSEAGKAFVITGTVTDDEETGGYTVSGVTVTEAEIQAAIAAGKAVVAKLTYNNERYELPLVYHDDQSQYQFGGNLGGFLLFFSISYTESGIGFSFSQIMSASADSLAGLSATVDNQNQILLPHVNDAIRHVTAEEKTAWNAKAAGKHASQHGANGSDPITPDAIGAVNYNAAQSLTDEQKAQARDNIGAAEKPKAVFVKIQAGGWNSSTKKQTVPVSGVSADKTSQVVWVTFLTETALDAYMDAGIVPVAQGANSVTFRADTIPTETIPVTVVMQEVSA